MSISDSENFSLTIVMPCYNEEDYLRNHLAGIVRFCQEKKCKLIMVDDCSTDATLEILKTFSADEFQIIRNKVNKGYGGAIKAGIEAATTKYVTSFDADGQYFLEDIEKLYRTIIEKDADMIVGRRKFKGGENAYRALGKWLIRKIAKILMPIKVHDINTGMKIYNTKLALKYHHLCPDSMAYSDIIVLVFISQKHLVMESDINVQARVSGKSTISARTAFETVQEILNIVVLFNPMRIFLPISITSIVVSLCWGIRIIVLTGKGVSVGSMLGITTGLIFFFLGLLAEQLSQIRKNK